MFFYRPIYWAIRFVSLFHFLLLSLFQIIRFHQRFIAVKTTSSFVCSSVVWYKIIPFLFILASIIFTKQLYCTVKIAF